MSDKMLRSDLIIEIAHRANFTKGDVEIIWDTYETILQELILEKLVEIRDNSDMMDIDVIDISGMFNMNIRKTKSHRHWLEITKEWKILPDFYRVIMKPSRTFARIIKAEVKRLVEEENKK